MRRGSVLRVRRGWYALPTTDPAVVAAARVGGSLTCVSGCGIRGVWIPANSGLHVAVPNGSRHLKSPTDGAPISGSGTGLTVHWNGVAGTDTSFQPGARPIRECLLEVLHCQPADLAFAVVESALALSLIGRTQILLLASEAPSRAKLLGLARTDAGSGTESVFRFRMAALGISMRSQVDIFGLGRVDFVIGDRLIVEIDSQQHHGSRESRVRDLDRDALAILLDYIPLRFDYVQVMSDWEVVASTVFAIVERGDHLTLKSVPGSTRRSRRPDATDTAPVTDFAMGESHLGATGSL
jgi:very-short-patch-repair endonuclease